MNVNGQDFMRNVSIEQDKADLVEQQDKLDRQKRTSVGKESDYDDSAYVDISIKTPINEDPTADRIQDIKLVSDNGSKNKKKYIILGLALILLFIITIVVVRVISNNDKEVQISVPVQKPQEIDKDKILDKINSSDEYQKVIEENKKISKSPTKKVQKKELKEIILPEATKEKSPIAIEKPKAKIEPKRDLFGLDNLDAPKKTVEKTVKKAIEPKVKAPIKQVKKKVVPKPAPIRRKRILPPAQETNFVKKASKVSGYYIQIGAFTKKPSDKLLNKITRKGYKYTIHTMTIKGKVYNKVLIGSYSKKVLAQQVINKVRKDFNNKNAYILKF